MFASVPLVVLFSSLAAFIPSSIAADNVVVAKSQVQPPAVMNRFARARAHRAHRRPQNKKSNTTETPDNVETLAASGGGYKISEQWSGANFFDDWNFYSAS